MKRRSGRKRKSGRRHPGGKLVQPHVSPLEVACAMPHRRGLGARAADQLAENQLGRLVLRGELEGVLALAGEYYAAAWRGWLTTLSAPRRAAVRDLAGIVVGGALDCGGCLGLVGTRFCMCAARKRKYLEADGALRAAGLDAQFAVTCIVLQDLSHYHPFWLAPLRTGLRALATHFGLTPRAKGILGNASSKNSSSTSIGGSAGAKARAVAPSWALPCGGER